MTDATGVPSVDEVGAQALAHRLRLWHDEPWTFVRDVFNVEPDTWQDEALHKVAKKSTRRLAMKACKGPGKTACLAWIVLWFLCTRVDAKIACTSITEANLDANLWTELSVWLDRSAFLQALFKWTSNRVVRRAAPSRWYAQKRTWPKSGTPEEQQAALAGFHGKRVLFVLDESGGMPQSLMVTADAVLANEDSEAKVIQSGNPTHTTGPLYRACTVDAHLWEIVTVNGDPDNPNRARRVSITWAREQIAQWGRDNPWVKVNVFGEFPPASINALLGAEEVELAMSRHYEKDVYMHMQKRIGVDVARFGDDRTVLFPRQGLWSGKPIPMRGARTNDIAARIDVAGTRWGAELIFVDDTFAWGHGVIDQLYVSGLMNVMPVQYHAPATSKRYKNRRAQFWIEGAEAIKKGAALYRVPEMIAELTEPTYTFDNGQFVLEPKEMVKERIGRSPDYADAYFQTYALPDMPADVAERLGIQKRKRDDDPYRDSQLPNWGRDEDAMDADNLSDWEV